MKPGREAALRWLRQAEHDLAIAYGHQERGDYSDACFMAEQAAVALVAENLRPATEL
jgi:HEPN domain-containing protein